MTLAAGLYRTPVTFQNLNAALDALGEQSTTTTNIIRTGARITSVPQAVSLRDGLEYAQGDILIDVKYSPSYDSITTASLVVVRGVTYNIISIDDRMFTNRDIRFTARRRR